jgi:uncharacterized Fe-S cluster protein YjdI
MTRSSGRGPLVPMEHTFSGRHITITYDDQTCTHAANCVRSLGAVFDAERTPWIDPDAAPVAEIVAVIAACPSGALQCRIES